MDDRSAGGARTIALKVIRRVVEQDAYSNLALAAELDRSRLTSRDRDLATELAYGTLRRIVALDMAIATVADRPIERITPRALALLRLGAYQLLETRIPPHAAVGETVALAQARERGFVNAILRRIAAAPPAPPTGAGDTAISGRTGLSVWAVRELRRVVGDEQVQRAAEAFAGRAPLTLRTNTRRSTVELLESELRAAGLHPRRGRLHPGSLSIAGGRVSDLPGFGLGWFAVQDESSAYVVDVLDPRSGDRVLDVCAGPGGKAADAADRVEPDGLLVAADASATRASLVARTLERLGAAGLVLAQDARRPAVAGGFDRVLVDAPCSGLGSSRRRPELLWRARGSDLSRLARLQVAIASGSAELLRPGGRLIYSVCTFPRAETDAVCDALLRHRPDLEPIQVDGPEGRASRLRLWPHVHGTDAMFIAAFRRRDGGG